MPQSWAHFDLTTHAPEVLRTDPRVYLQSGTYSQGCGQCIGTIVMENPGDKPPSVTASGWHSFRDSTIGIIEQLVECLQLEALRIIKPVQPDDYVEILNLYYFCNSTSITKLSNSALPAWSFLCSGSGTPYAPRPSTTSKFIFVAWGMKPHANKDLNQSIQTMCSYSKPTYMVDDNWRTTLIMHPPATYPRHPRRFFKNPKGSTAGLLPDIAIQLAPHLSIMKTSTRHLCSVLAELAGLQWSGTIDYQFIDAETSEVDNLDPFFESLGRWDESTRTVQVFRNRCHHAAARFHASLSCVEQVVLVHHCAHAVTQLGVLPETGKTYIRFGDPAKAFKHENYPLKPTHEFYNDLIREEERFAQIFAYLLLVGKSDSEELRVFNSLSQGHCGLYEIAASNLVRGELRHDWRQEVINDRKLAIQCAARTLATKTRSSQNNKGDLLLFCDFDE